MLDPRKMLPPSSARTRNRALGPLCLCLYLVLGVTATAQPVCAQASETVPAGYDDLIKRAIVEFDNSHWAEARALFRRAHELSPNARTFRGLGITAFELRRYVEATAELRASLDDGNKPLTSKQREEVESLLGRAREFVAVFTVTLAPADAELLVDGVSPELDASRLSVDPGPHRLLVRAAGYQERELELSADPGQRQALQITLQPLRISQPAPVAGPTTLPVEPVRQAPRGRRTFTWIFAGAAVGTAAAGVAMGLIARGENDDYKSCSGDDCAGLRDDGQRHERIANVMFGVTGGLAVASVVAFFVEGKSLRERETASTELRIQPFGAALTHRF